MRRAGCVHTDMPAVVTSLAIANAVHSKNLDHSISTRVHDFTGAPRFVAPTCKRSKEQVGIQIGGFRLIGQFAQDVVSAVSAARVDAFKNTGRTLH